MAIQDYPNYELNHELIESQLYNLREYAGAGRTRSFSGEDIAIAKNLVIKKLTEEDLEKFHPELLLIDNDNPHVIVVHVMFDDKVMYVENASRNRTYYIIEREIVDELKDKKQPVPK